MNLSPSPRGAWPRALALLLLTSLACVKRPVDYEREYARTLAPKQQAPKPAVAGAERPARRVVRVRLYADALYRRQVLHWEQGFREQLRRATQETEGTLGVVFELDSAQPWSLAADRYDLDAALAELESLDAGNDVDLVVGLLPALRAFSASHADLGRARMYGRHAVLRGMENPDEHQQILNVLRHLPAAEQDQLYRERKLHKETAVLLHEWAHTLGAVHESDSKFTMAPLYEVTQEGFSPPTLQLLALSLRHMPLAHRDPEARRAWARELQQLLTTTAWAAWEGPDKVQALEWTARVQEGREPLPREPPQQLSARDRARFEQVRSLDQQGRVEVAAQTLTPLVGLYPRNPAVQVMACYLGLRVAPTQDSTWKQCETTSQAFPEQSSAPMNLASLRLDAGDAAGAQLYLAEARQRMLTHGLEDTTSWAHLAGLLRNASCVTWAEEAAARAKGAKGAAEVQSWAARTRLWSGLPPPGAPGAVAPEREGDFVRAVRRVEDQLVKKALPQARGSIAKLGKDFPGAAVQQQLECELQVRAGQLGAARTSCQRALKAQDSLVQAHFLLGWMADASGARPEARTRFERVIAFEPAHAEAWRLLARQYRALGLRAELDALEQRHRQQFSRALP